MTATTAAAGTAAASTEQTGYTVDGQVGSVTDGEGNTTSYGYDAYGRGVRTTYPGGSYEELGFDAGGRVQQQRLRDGQVLFYGYDALGRRVHDDNPNTNVAEVDATYEYDLQGRVTYAGDQNGWWARWEYDALGRATRQWSNLSSNWMGYDAGGRRVRQTWADGFFVTYEYDAGGRMTAVRENGGFALAIWGYDDLGRRTSMWRGNGMATGYGYDAAGRLVGLSHDLAGGAWDVDFGFAYNPAGQIATRTSNNDIYSYTGHYNVDRPYAVNGLNQYTGAGGVGFSYDGRGNLTSDGTHAWAYNTRNELFVNDQNQLFYRNPVGLLNHVIANGQVTNLDYVGSELATEFDGATGAVKRRYVYGSGTDEPLVAYENGVRRYLHADERGSVIALSDDAGAAVAINRYDEYGIPAATNIGRFQYTGQKWIPELGLYDYKARMYSPTLGRFMQTDPIGYADGLNWYNYVGGDPVNGADPSGTKVTCTGSIIATNDCSHVNRLSINGVDTGVARMAQENAVSDALPEASRRLTRLTVDCINAQGCAYGALLLGSAQEQTAQGLMACQKNLESCSIIQDRSRAALATMRGLANDVDVMSAIGTATMRSGYQGVTSSKNEVGFWARQREGDFSVTGWRGGSGNSSVFYPVPTGSDIYFHVHPFSRTEGFLPGLSPQDLGLGSRNHVFMFSFSPEVGRFSWADYRRSSRR